MIKAVLFDLDGTLLDRVRSLIHFAEKQHQRFHDILKSIWKYNLIGNLVTLQRLFAKIWLRCPILSRVCDYTRHAGY